VGTLKLLPWWILGALHHTAKLKTNKTKSKTKNPNWPNQKKHNQQQKP